MGGISISYRRDDSTSWAGRLSEHLKERLRHESILTGNAIEPDTHITKALHTHDAFISYSLKDEAFASTLEKALEAYILHRRISRSHNGTSTSSVTTNTLQAPTMFNRLKSIFIAPPS